MSSNIIEVKIALGIDTRIFVTLNWSKLFSLIVQNKIYINFIFIYIILFHLELSRLYISSAVVIMIYFRATARFMNQLFGSNGAGFK